MGLFHGNLLTLLNPYGLLGGVLFLVLFLQHGALWLALKTDGELHERAERTAEVLWPVALVTAVVFLVSSRFATNLYDNYLAQPALFAVVAVAVVALAAVRVFLARRDILKAWFASALTIVGATFFGVIGLFPNLFPSSLSPRYHLTAFNSSSSPLTLKLMLGVVVVFVPVVLAYQIWAYSKFRTRVNREELTY
jgi:cytochrome d ubiquinol oxidase subunit II